MEAPSQNKARFCRPVHSNGFCVGRNKDRGDCWCSDNMFLRKITMSTRLEVFRRLLSQNECFFSGREQ